jgi:hypothetical protein
MNEKKKNRNKVRFKVKEFDSITLLFDVLIWTNEFESITQFFDVFD